MSAPLTLLTLLGASSFAEAAERWPREVFLPDVGLVAGGDDAADYEPLMVYLNQVLSFSAVRPGVGPDRVGLVAEVVVTHAGPPPEPLVLRQLPDIGFVLLDNAPGDPARIFVTQSDVGVEVVVEGLPVEVQLPERPADAAAHSAGGGRRPGPDRRGPGCRLRGRDVRRLPAVPQRPGAVADPGPPAGPLHRGAGGRHRARRTDLGRRVPVQRAPLPRSPRPRLPALPGAQRRPHPRRAGPGVGPARDLDGSRHRGHRPAHGPHP